MDDCCIVNPTVQTILKKISKEVRGLGADGVMFDITDIYPNSTSGRYPPRKDNNRPLQNTCFCRHCIEALKREKWLEGGDPFRKLERNPARYVLQATLSGATPIDVRDSWLDKLEASELAEFAGARGFVENQDEDGRKDALKLLHYLIGRSKITANAVKKLCEGAAEAGLRTSIAIGSPAYDMSTQTNISTLIAYKCADEYWAPSFERSHLEKKEATLLRLLAARGTYYMNATFANLNTLSNERLYFDDKDIKELMEQFVTHAATLENRNELNIGQVAQVPLVEGIDGFVGIPFGKTQLIDLITKKTADGTFSEKHKTELLSKLEAGVTRLTSNDQVNTPGSSAWD